MKFSGQALKAARERADLTQEQLASRCGTTVGTISQLERDLREPTLTTIAKIAAELGIPMTSLLTTPETVA